jgi:hypothetical protein
MRIPNLPKPTTGIAVFTIAILLVVAGGFSVYVKPDSDASGNFAKILPYPAALVGPRIVLSDTILSETKTVQTFATKTGQGVPAPSELRRQILDQKIETALARNELARRNQYVTPAMVDAQYAKLTSENEGEEQVEKVLQDLYGIGPKEFKKMIADRLALDLVRENLLSAVFVRHILVAEEGLANDVVKQIREGKDFAEAAKTFSKDSASKDKGGELGWVYRGQLATSVEEAAFKANIGEVQNPVKTDLGWEIIQVSDRRGSIDKSYETWLSDAKKETKIVILLRR